MLVQLTVNAPVNELLADPEVTDLCQSQVGLHQDVVWLDVPVDLSALVVQVVESLQDVPGKASDNQFGNQGAGLAFLVGLTLTFDGNHGVDGAAVHVLHDQVDFAFVEETAVISDLIKLGRGLTKTGQKD